MTVDEQHGFSIEPPDFEQQTERSGLFPPSQDAAWMLQLIKLQLDKTSLPDDIKQSLLLDLGPYIDNAGMSNMTRGEVKMFLGEFEELWMKYKIFVYRKKFKKELNYIKTYVRTLLMQNYNKAIEGWQGNHVFERHTRQEYKIRQTQEDVSEKIKGVFRKKKHEEDLVP